MASVKSKREVSIGRKAAIAWKTIQKTYDALAAAQAAVRKAKADLAELEQAEAARLEALREAARAAVLVRAGMSTYDSQCLDGLLSYYEVTP